jgi:lambda family phage minor tail protein L
MTDLIDTVQLQEIDQGYVELFDFTLPSGTLVHLFKGLEDGTTSIYFPSKDGSELNEYIAMPLELTGVEVTSSGASNRPTLSMANIPSLTRTLASNETTLEDIKEGEVEALLSGEGIYTNEDFLGTVVEYRSTLTSYLKEEGDVASFPVEFPSHRFVLDRVSSENNILVQFELATVFDLEGVKLPYRQINGRYCPWQYQGHALSNQGGCTWPLDSHGRFFDKNDDVLAVPPTYNNSAKTAGTNVKTITNGHTQIWQAVRDVPANKDPQTHGAYWKRLDVCGKLISSCKVRFQGVTTETEYSAGTEYSLNNIVIFNEDTYLYINETPSTGNTPTNTQYWAPFTEDTSKELPFGGFPGTRKFK